MASASYLAFPYLPCEDRGPLGSKSLNVHQLGPQKAELLPEPGSPRRLAGTQWEALGEWGLGMQAPLSTREERYGEEQALHPCPLFQYWVRVSRCQPGGPTYQAPHGGAGYSLPGKPSCIPELARPAQLPPHFPVLKSPPRAGLGPPGHNLAMALGFPPGFGGPPGGTSVGRASISWPPQVSPPGLLA